MLSTFTKSVVIGTALAAFSVPASAQMTRAWTLARAGAPCRLLLAPDGDLIVGATVVIPGGSAAYHDSIIARYSPTGQLRWLWQSGESQDDFVRDLALDAQGNIIAYGVIGTSNFGQAPFVARIIKFLGTGQRQWTSTYVPQRTGLNTYAEGVRIAPDGGIYIFGKDNGQTTSQDMFIARYTPSGSHQWTFRRAGPVVDSVFDVAFDAQSNAYWVGSTFRPGTSLLGGTLGKLNTSGQQQWVWLQPIPPTNDAGGWLHDVSVDHEGNIVATGHNEYFPGFQDGVVLRTTPSGQVLSHVVWDGPDGRWDRFFTHAIMSDNRLIVSGDTYAGDGAEYYDVPTLCFSPSGQELWRDIYGSTLYYPNSTEEWSLNTMVLPGDQVLTISTDWARPGYDYALHRYSGSGSLLERVVAELPAGSADIKEIPTRCAAYDSAKNSVYMLGWGAGPTSDPLTDHYTLIRINLPALSAPCEADLDSDGSLANGGTPDGAVDINDMLFFLAAFEAGHIGADLDNDGNPSAGTPDGGVTVEDLLFFLARFEDGC
jgi:hypothetical protein